MSKPAILIVEDEGVIAKDIENAILKLGYRAAGRVSSGEDALRVAEQSPPDLVLMDIKLKGEMDGIECADIMRARFDVPVVYMTAYMEEDIIERSKQTEPYGYLRKPVGVFELRTTIETVLHKHESDRRVRESEEQYRLLAENSLQGVYIHQDDYYVYANSRLCEITGLSSEEMLKTRFWEIFTPDVQETIKEKGHARYHGEVVEQQYESRIRHKDGSTRWVEISSVRFIRKGRPATMGTIADVTERKRAEQDLKSCHDRWRVMLETAVEGIWVMDAHGMTTFANQQMADMLGTSVDEMVGSTFREYLYEEAVLVAEDLFRRRTNGIKQQHEIRFHRRDGEELWALVSASPLFDADGNFTGAFGMVTKTIVSPRLCRGDSQRFDRVMQ